MAADAPAYRPRAARKARRKVRRLERRVERMSQKKTPKYDPLAPLTGARAAQERKAAEKLQFGPRARELEQAQGVQQQTAVDRAGYFDEWRDALRGATARVNETNRQNVEATQNRVDTSYAEDKASLEQRDKVANETAAKLGRAPTVSTEGHQAVEAQRSQGNQSLARLRGQAGADGKYFELRGVNASQAKIEDQDKMAARAKKLREESQDLASDRGAFRADHRRQTRKDEREWSAIQKEFGLKSRELAIDSKSSRQDRNLERQKLATQKIVARIYGAADKAGARAQVRVARLQLEKGKIDQRQYKRIVNVYEGLPGGGPGSKPNAKPGVGSGPNGTLAPWEKDKVSDAVHSLRKHPEKATNKQVAIRNMIAAGVPARLARIAWKRYHKGRNQAPGSTDGAGGYGD